MQRFLKFLSITFLIFLANQANAQEINLPKLDASPADIAILRASRGADPVAKITYGRPQKKGRQVFGGEVALVPYDKLWRTGANETTELILYKDAKMGGKELKAGTYSLYSFPQEEAWTIVVNSKLHTWGHFQYDETQDVVRFEAESKEYATTVEAFTITFGNVTESSAALYLVWENRLVEIPIEF